MEGISIYSTFQYHLDLKSERSLWIYSVLSLHAQLCPTLCNPWTVAHRAPLSMAFPRQEYWNGLPFPTLGDLPNLGTEPTSPVSPASAGGFFNTEPPGKPSPSIHSGGSDTSLKSLSGGFPFTLSFRAIPEWDCKRAAHFQFTLT